MGRTLSQNVIREIAAVEHHHGHAGPVFVERLVAAKDVFEVINAAKTKPFGFMAFYPGPGLGGHCIPIDPFYLTWKAREFGFGTRFIELAGEINSNMPQYVVDRVVHALDVKNGLGLSHAKILVVGIAYKKDVDDTRESPGLMILNLLAVSNPKCNRAA